MSETSTVEPAHSAPRRQARGTARREAIIRATCELILNDGPVSVTHRAVAARAEVPLAATTYYFNGLDDLIGAAGERIAEGWAEHARTIRDKVNTDHRGDMRRVATYLVDAVLPPGGLPEIRGFYEHLVSAGRYETLSLAYAKGRGKLDAMIGDICAALNVAINPRLVVAITDGAVVSALSEGREAHEHAVTLVEIAVSSLRSILED